MAYNELYKMEESIPPNKYYAYPISYADGAAMANILDDLNRELDKPLDAKLHAFEEFVQEQRASDVGLSEAWQELREALRFVAYPVDATREMRRRVRDVYVNFCLTMEVEADDKN